MINSEKYLPVNGYIQVKWRGGLKCLCCLVLLNGHFKLHENWHDIRMDEKGEQVFVI